MTKTAFRFLGVPLILGALALGACGSTPTSGAPDQVNGTGAKAQGEPGHEGLPFLHAVLKLDDLTEDQRVKVLAIGDAYKSAIAPRRLAGAELAELYAKALETGKMDDAAVDAKLADLEKLATSDKASLAVALDGLHATLTPAQRTALVESIAKGHHGKDGKGKDGKEWKKDGKHEGKMGMHGPLKHLVKDLDLTDAQKESFESKLEEAKPAFDKVGMMANLKAIGDAFQTNTFDAKSHDLTQLGHSPAKFAAHMRKVVAVSIEVLDAGQRAKMATKLREFAAKKG